jgi:O-antigen/teichoic acid export membrane protein
MRVGAIATVALALIDVVWIAFGEPASTQSRLLVSLLFGVAYLALMFGVNVTAGLLVQRGRVASLWRARLSGAAAGMIATVALMSLRIHASLAYVAPPLIDLVVAFTVGLVFVRAAGSVATPSRETTDSDPPLRAAVWRYGRDSALTQLPAQLHMRLDRAIILYLMSTEALGVYSAAQSWSSAVFMIGGALGPALLSSNIRKDPSDPAVAISALLRLRRLALVIGVTTVVFAALAPVGVPLVFGAAFHAARLPTVILTCAFGVVATKSLLHEYARSVGAPALGRPAEIAGLVAGALLTTALGHWAGLMGIALGVLLSFLVVAITMAVAIAQRVPQSDLAHLPPMREDVTFLRDSVLAYARGATDWLVRRASPSRRFQ